MDILRISIIGFLCLETANVAALYFFPGSKYANSVGVFKAWERSKDDPQIHDFVKYLVNWVAGTKLLFIALLLVILFTADSHTLIVSGFALMISIASFYWRLFPLVRKMDREGQMELGNYSAVLGWMILALILIFFVGTVLALCG
ncbi:MAG: hypothetical protein PVF83_19515 [Anaerolineales bacterium]|jgi:hypothetical protein